MRAGKVYADSALAGTLTEDVEGYHFVYDTAYLNDPNAKPVSLTLPLRVDAYHGQVLFPFFDGLIPTAHTPAIHKSPWMTAAKP